MPLEPAPRPLEPPPLVVITDLAFGSERNEIERGVLEPLGARVERHRCRSEADVLGAARGADVLMVHWAPITQRVLDGLERCRLVLRYGVGVDMIDVAAASRRGVLVCNAPDFCTEEVATHAVALMLALARKVVPLADATRRGEWDAVKHARPTRNLSGQTLGLLSLGRIARLVASRAQGFGMRVIAHDPYVAAGAAAAAGVELVSFEALLEGSDYLSLHAPLTERTRHVVDEAALSRLRPGAVLINTARGALVDTAALEDALRSGRLGGAGLDVLEEEPPPPDHPLLALPNVILTPHAAWYSDDALPRLQRQLAEDAARFLLGDRPGGVVNPEVLDRSLAEARSQRAAGPR